MDRVNSFNGKGAFVQMSGNDFARLAGLIATKTFLILLNRDLEELKSGVTTREKLKQTLPQREALFTKFSEVPQDILTAYQVAEKLNAYKAFLEDSQP